MPKIYESPDKGKTYTEREFTVEGRPPFTKQMEQFNMDVYETARRDRLADCIGDYLTDENCSARRAYDELLAEAKGWVDYHQTNLDKANEFYQLLLGHKECTPIECADSFATE
jgi:hypothetical protein